MLDSSHDSHPDRPCPKTDRPAGPRPRPGPPLVARWHGAAPRGPGGDLMAEDPKTPREPSLKSETRQTNWRRANMAKYTAHLAVQRALVSGALQRQGCEVCGNPVVDAHHDRYDQPLAVRWLCRRHHVRLHHGGEDMFPIGPSPAAPDAGHGR